MKYDIALQAHLDLIREMGTASFMNHTGKYASALGDAGDLAVLAMHPDIKSEVTGRDGAFALEGGAAQVEKLATKGTYHIGAGLAKHWRHHLSRAETFYISPGMVDEVVRRLDTHDLQRGISRHHVMSSSGFVMFGKPYTAIDNSTNVSIMHDLGFEEPDSFPIHAFAWMPHPNDPGRLLSLWFIDQQGALFEEWVDKQSERYKDDLRSKMPPGTETPDPWIIQDGDWEGTPTEMLRRNLPGRFILDTTSVMAYETTSPIALRAEANRMLCMVLLTLIEPIGRMTGVPPASKMLRKERKRSPLPNEGDINVLYLRHEVARDPDLKEALAGRGQHRYRHAVRSHWRRYWVGSGTEKRREWRKVTEHWRGDGPTVATENVYVLKR
jgi:hypothetical protein